MNPEDWLKLAEKHIQDPDSVDRDELAQLRTNYVIWKASHECCWQRAKNTFFQASQVAFKGARVSDEAWKELSYGATVPEDIKELLSDEAITLLKEAQEAFVAYKNLMHQSRTLMNFYKEFDKEFEAVNGSLAPDVQEMLWKNKAESLASAIERHRRSYVLANKQANGLDFALWAEVDLDEFHPSSHICMEMNGSLPAMRGG